MTKKKTKKNSMEEMRMRRWMQGFTKRNRIRNINMLEQLDVALISEKMRGNMYI